MAYIVYEITVADNIRYIGMTKNIIKREYEHNYAFKRGDKKELYDYIKSIGYSPEYYITLNRIKGFKTRADAKRFEIFLIIWDHFYCNKMLKQKIPSISDR
jgi:predicted GIY-YIG superfamily endonuclease